MTTQELINYYCNLLILQYIGKTNAYSTVAVLVQPVIMDQLPTLVQNAFNMDGTSVGVQLDVLGKYVGVTRNGTSPTGIPITLSDADFFKLIKLATITNSEGSDLNTIQNLLQIFFAGEIFVFDHKTMRLSYFVNTSLGSLNLLELFISEGLLPKPMGVQLSAPIFDSALTFFGMVDSSDVAAYAIQNSVSISAAVAAIMTADNITPLNDSTSPTTTVWLNADLGVAV
jgi:hypothetical protein